MLNFEKKLLDWCNQHGRTWDMCQECAYHCSRSPQIYHCCCNASESRSEWQWFEMCHLVMSSWLFPSRYGGLTWDPKQWKEGQGRWAFFAACSFISQQLCSPHWASCWSLEAHARSLCHKLWDQCSPEKLVLLHRALLWLYEGAAAQGIATVVPRSIFAPGNKGVKMMSLTLMAKLPCYISLER